MSASGSSLTRRGSRSSFAGISARGALVISEEVLLGDAYRIGIGGAGVTGEKEEVLGDDM